MNARSFTLDLPDGRELEVVEEGDPDGVLLVFHHGSPGAAVPFEAFDVAAADKGIILVSYSRPGFGGSSRHQGRRVVDCVPDVAAIADHFGQARFLTAGWSGGGPHALACAARLPDRVLAAATIASVAPYDAEGLDWVAGMGELNQVEYPLAARDPEAHLAWISNHMGALARATPQVVLEELRSVISPVDEASLDGELGEMIAGSLRRAFVDGPWGWRDDDLAFVAPWGFDLSKIRVPVTIWQGRQDLMVPISHGEWLLAHVPAARSGLRPEHGHLSLAVGSFGEILEDLAGGRQVD